MPSRECRIQRFYVAPWLVMTLYRGLGELKTNTALISVAHDKDRACNRRKLENPQGGSRVDTKQGYGDPHG